MISSRNLHLTALLCTLFSPPSQATVVRMAIGLGGTPAGDIYIGLFDADAPVTVKNFLNYVDDGNGVRRYDGTFIHRSISNFVVQGGGFSYDPGKGPFDTGDSTPHIAQDPPIVNEFSPSRSNVRGTVAMAKTAVSPDTATSEWFFNLADNSANLDFQNGGFTVFGRVLGKGMDLVDTIAALPKPGTDIIPPNTTFSDLPVTGYTLGDPIALSNLVTVDRVDILQPVQPSVQDFGPTALGTIASATVTIQNLGTSPATISPIPANGLAAPFRISSENCSGTSLAVNTSCTLLIEYQPQTAGTHRANLDITTDSNEISILRVSVTGSSGDPQAATLSHDAPDLYDFGDLGPGAQRQFKLTLSNKGIDPLTINGIAFTGTGSDHFSVTNNCSVLNLGDTCTETLTFAPAFAGPVATQLEIRSSDPARPLVVIPVAASASSDQDGVPDAIEAAAPNNGDGNLDGVADILQDRVVSLPDIKGNYVTLTADTGSRFTAVTARQNPSPASTPATTGASRLDFPLGFFSFTLEGVSPGGSATVTLLLPPGQSADAYFKYGRLPTDFFLVPDHWYQFDFRGGTGARFSGNQVILHFIDGGRGDNDLAADGRIVDPGGPAVLTLDKGSSGGGCTVGEASPRQFPVAWLAGAAFVAAVRRRGRAGGSR